MTTKKTDYESLNIELNQVLETLQSPELDIDTAVAGYEQGMRLIEELETQLKSAENKITKIKQQWDAKK